MSWYEYFQLESFFVFEIKAFSPHSHLFDQIKHVERQLKDIQNESTYLWIRQKAHLTQVQQIHSRAFWLSMAQFVVIFMMTAAQITYIKGLVGHGIRHRAAGGIFPL